MASIVSHAQIVIDGHYPFLDEASHTLLFVTDSLSVYDLTAKVEVADPTWKNVQIDGRSITSRFHFGDVSDNRCFLLTAASGGLTVCYSVCFTILPVLHIAKATPFHNGYEEASIVADGARGGFDGDTLRCVIKHRGGSTNSTGRHKRNYKFKIHDQQGRSLDLSFCGMRRDNKWILDAGQIDLFRLRNNITHKLWLDFSTQPYYTNDEPKAVNGCHTACIELFVNHEYRGVYNLMEPVDRKQLKLKKYKAQQVGTRGLLYKTVSWVGTTFFTLPEGAFNNRKSAWCGWEAKYPEPGDDADTTDFKPLEDFIRFVVTTPDAVFKAGIADHLDLGVYRDYVLLVQLTNALDNVGKNMYWSVYDRTKGNIKFVPTPWDLDATFGQYCADDHPDSAALAPTNRITTVTNIDRRLRTVDKAWREDLASRYADLRRSWFSYSSLAGRFQQAYDMLHTSGAGRRETEKWSGDSDIAGNKLDYDHQLAYIKSWIRSHLQCLDDLYGYQDATGISTLKHSVKGTDALYNLNGQMVSPTYHGIVIKNGRKYLQR